MKESKSQIPEGILNNQLNQSTLPPLWQIIYNEGILGNHILFNDNDVRIFDNSPQLFDTSITESESQLEAFQSVIVAIVTRTNLSEMNKTIETLSSDLKKSVYIYYRRMLYAWRDHLKLTLN